MKVQVIVKTSDKVITSVKATVSAKDKVANLMEFVAESAGVVAFPDHELLLGGIALSDRQILSECGIEDGDVLEFLFQASEKMMSKQISELLGTNKMSIEELSLIYSYRYGMSLQDALKVIGQSKQSFFENHKQFSFQDGQVKTTAMPDDSSQSQVPLQHAVKSFIDVDVRIEINTELKAKPGLLYDEEDDVVSIRLRPSQTVAEAKKVIQEVAQVTFPDMDLCVGDQKLQDGATIGDVGVVAGCSLVMIVYAEEKVLIAQLEELLLERIALSLNDLALLYSQRHGVSVSNTLRSLGLRSNLRRFVEGRSEFFINRGCISLASGPEPIVPGLNHLSCIMEAPDVLSPGILCY